MIDPKRIEQIPIIREKACQSRKLAKEIVSSRSGPYETDDFLGAMTDLFMHKQIAHIKSICVLVDANQSPDALIITRSAYENMALLLWAAHEPPRKNVPRQWFLYEIKEGYCRWINGKYNDLDLDPKIEETLIKNVRNYADILLTRKGKEKLLHGKKLECNQDFIVNKLPPIEKIFSDESLEGRIYPRSYALYQILSRWQHGDPQGMGMVFQHDGKCLSPNEITCRYLGGCAIMIGLQSLLNTAILFNDHFKLGFKDRLMEMNKELQCL